MSDCRWFAWRGGCARAVLGTLARDRGWLTNAELAETTGYERSSVATATEFLRRTEHLPHRIAVDPPSPRPGGYGGRAYRYRWDVA